jgi:O-antigen/teichoic acid export membrane protein
MRLRGPVLVFLADALFLPVGLLTVVLLGRLWGPADYGLYGLALSITLWLEWLVVALFGGVGLQMMARDPKSEEVPNFLLQANMAVGTAAALLLAVAAPLLAAEPLRSLLWLGALMLPLAGVGQAHRARLIVLERFSVRAAGVALKMLVRALGTVGVVSWGGGVVAGVAILPLAGLVEVIFYRFWLQTKFWGGRGKVRLPLRSAAAFLVFTGSQRLVERLDLLLLRALGLPLAEVGMYAAAQSVAMPPALLGNSYASTVQTRVHLAESRTVGRRAGWRAMAIGLGTLPAALVAVFLAEPLVALAYGPKFGGTAELVAPLLLAGSLHATSTLASAVLQGLGHVRWTSVLGVTQVAVTAVALLVVVPRYGAAGAAWTWCASAGLAAAAGALLLRRSKYTVGV